MIPKSGLYVGRVMHTRFHPRRHRLAYRCYWLLVDLDDLELLGRRFKLLSYNRRNAFSIRDADHGSGDDVPLGRQIRQHLLEAEIDLQGGKIMLLCMPRILGYVFNPISLYYCFDGAGQLAAMIYEVHNTFGQRHSYLVGVNRAASPEIKQQCAKRFYVSPFLEMDLTYGFDVMKPGPDVRFAVRAFDRGRLVLAATLVGKRRELTDGALLNVFFTHPLLSLKVIAAIHWEAARLWLKGVRLIDRPQAPSEAITVALRQSREAQ